jgi:hypothetical protein
MRYNQNFENVIKFLKINRYGFYPPTKTNEKMHNYFKEKGINFTYSKTDSGFYKFELID